MTATWVPASDCDTAASVDLATPVGKERLGAELEAFLADPVGYGHFDPADPITLDEFVSARHHRGRYVAPLAF